MSPVRPRTAVALITVVALVGVTPGLSYLDVLPLLLVLAAAPALAGAGDTGRRR